MITHRLADSVPRAVRLRHDAGAAERRRIDALLDRGLGGCVLRRAAVARMVIHNWLRFDGLRYRLHTWVVMPNHVHLVATIGSEQSLSKIVHAWKSYTSHRIRRIVGATGRIWQPE